MAIKKSWDKEGKTYNEKKRFLKQGEAWDEEDEELWRQLDSLDDDKETSKVEVDHKEKEIEREKDLARYKKINSKRGFYYNCLDFKNPYRDQSQLDLDEVYDNGFRRIETKVLFELMRKKLTGYEWSIFFYILHKTRGFSNMKNKFRIEEEIKIRKAIKETGLSRSSIYRVLNSLSDKKIIYSIDDNGRIKYGINYRYDTWA
jgi:hypothetical protein